LLISETFKATIEDYYRKLKLEEDAEKKLYHYSLRGDKLQN